MTSIESCSIRRASWYSARSPAGFRSRRGSFRSGPGTGDELAHVLKTTLQKLEVALDNQPYNDILHTAPFHADNFDLSSYHWHLEIIPRLTGVAGFEWGSGFYINSVPPEEAGAFLRQAEI